MKDSNNKEVISIEKKLDLLLDEKSKVQTIKLAMQKEMIKLVGIFITTFATIAGLFTKKLDSQHDQTKELIMFILSHLLITSSTIFISSSARDKNSSDFFLLPSWKYANPILENM